jgi:hypothetical protein
VIASLLGSRVTDKDRTPVNFTILYGNDDGLFAVNASTGVFFVRESASGQQLDVERKSQYLVVVQAMDPGGLQCSLEVCLVACGLVGL